MPDGVVFFGATGVMCRRITQPHHVRVLPTVVTGYRPDLQNRS